ncbi:MAG: CapA family protein [Chthonomonas sp.]|nr:CapA family protein [Chthonomonas sp.]
MLIAAAIALAPPTWTLVVGGDLMLNAITPKSKPMAGVAQLFRTADVAYANLEIPLTDAKTVTPRKSAADLKAKRQFVLKADPGHVSTLTSMGLDLVSLANNHAMDYGAKGLNQMLGLLDKAGIAHSGAGANVVAANEVAVFRNRYGIRVGMLSYLCFVGAGALNTCGPASAKTPGIATLNYGGALDEKNLKDLTNRILAARKRCDVLIVAPHWGDERARLPKDWQLRLGRAMIAAGADAVVGAHPHVLQGSEIVGGQPIHYSLGNLISPRPANTGVYRLTFSGKKYVKTERLTYTIAGGVIKRRKGKDAASAAKDLAELDKILARRTAQLFPRR